MAMQTVQGVSYRLTASPDSSDHSYGQPLSHVAAHHRGAWRAGRQLFPGAVCTGEIQQPFSQMPSWGVLAACSGRSLICCSSSREGGLHEPLQLATLEELRARLARTGRKVLPGSSLAANNPALAAMWHPTLNGSLTPDEVTPSSDRKAWWLCSACPAGQPHVWETRVGDRTAGNGCPYCSARSVCKCNSLATKDPVLAARWHPIKNGSSTPDDVTVSSTRKAWWLCNKCPAGQPHECQAALANITAGKGCPFCSSQSVCECNSLAANEPAVAAQWHPTKNGSLTPSDLTQSSNRKAWWLCDQCPAGQPHVWQATVDRRTAGNGCPYCSGRRVCKCNSLATKDPVLAAQWHPTKNGSLTPDDVTASSHRKAWWLCGKCPAGQPHKWQAALYNRTRAPGSTAAGNSCPYCAGQRTCMCKALDFNRPDVAAHWHPTMNKGWQPKDAIVGSNRRVWWRCPAGTADAPHVWQQTVGTCARRSATCPYCNLAGFRKLRYCGNFIAVGRFGHELS